MGKILELILREDVAHLGRRGDVIQVKNGYARNYLLPRKLAVPLTEGNRKAVEQQKASALRHEVSEKSEAEQLAAMLASLTLTIARKAGETGALFGSVTSLDVGEALQQQGYEIDRRKILLEEPLKQLGEYQVPLRLHREVTASITVQVVPEQA